MNEVLESPPARIEIGINADIKFQRWHALDRRPGKRHAGSMLASIGDHEFCIRIRRERDGDLSAAIVGAPMAPDLARTICAAALTSFQKEVCQ